MGKNLLVFAHQRPYVWNRLASFEFWLNSRIDLPEQFALKLGRRQKIFLENQHKVSINY